jgi:N-acetyl sugar amidotransferase
MDTSDKKIIFDSNGVCNHCLDFDSRKKEMLVGNTREQALENIIKEVKKTGKGKKYDCIVGISGGVDSSYVALLAKEWDLKVLLVHLDNGWNSELAVKNVENIVKHTGFDLYTLVINWEEFKSLQRTFFKADVVDLELLSDHAIFATVYKLTRKYGIKYLLSGENFETEAIMPTTWNWRKSDAKNIKSIYKYFNGSPPLKTFPFMGTVKRTFYQYGGVAKSISVLDYMDYNKENVMDALKEKLEWKYYGGKHYESLFTRFYQGFVLPKKFGIDKRRAHFSTLINSGQMAREDAIDELKKITYPENLQREDFELVCKKLNFTEEELEAYLKRPPISHAIYGTDEKVMHFMRYVYRLLLK